MNKDIKSMTTQTSQTLGDIFLDILENNSTDGMKHIIRATKLYMTFPDYAEFFNVLLINALGYPAQISENKVDNAVGFVIKQNELSISQNIHLSEREKEEQIDAMKSFINFSKCLLKDCLRNNNILIQ